VRALLASITCEKGDRGANLATHLDLLRQGAQAGCDVVVFPEFSLTGSIDPQRRPEDAIRMDDTAVAALTAATAEFGIAAVFGLSERSGGAFFITQAVAADGRLLGAQRKRHLGKDELQYSTGEDAFVFEVREHGVGIVICAEGHVDSIWDATRQGGAEVVLFCSAPGLYGRKTNEAEWRAGFDWWESWGLADARLHAERLELWVAMATQAGTATDEDFPGIAALISPEGVVVDRLPDWKPGTLVVEIPPAHR
jgi:predicted amidohydrolase